MRSKRIIKELGGRGIPRSTLKALADTDPRRQDDEWAARSGPMTVSYMCICPRRPCKADEHKPDAPDET